MTQSVLDVNLQNDAENNRWVAQPRFHRPDGKMIRKTKTFNKDKYKTKSTAVKAAKTWANKIQADFNAHVVDPMAKITVGEFASKFYRIEFIEEINISKATFAKYETEVNRPVFDKLKKMNLTQLSQQELADEFRIIANTKFTTQGFARSKNSERFKPSESVLHNIIRAWKSVFKFAAQKHFIAESPMSSGFNPKKFASKQQIHKADSAYLDLHPEQIFNPDEYTKLINFVRFTEKNDQLARMMETMLYCGLRTEELCALNLETIDLGRKTILVNTAMSLSKYGRDRKNTKTGESRLLHLNETAFPIVQKQVQYALQHGHQKDKDGYTPLFVQNSGKYAGGPWFTAQISTEFSKHRDACGGLPTYGMYSLRHTFASTMLSLDLNPAVIANQMGHSIDTFFKYYVHPLKSDFKKMQAINFATNKQ